MIHAYDDEDNAPMNDDVMPEDPVLKYTTYSSLAEMKAVESGEIPFDDPPANGCWNCMNFDWRHEACTLNWNNLDESYYCPDTDDRELTDYCDDHEIDPDAGWEEIFDNE
jgi:hypothetical protein